MRDIVRETFSSGVWAGRSAYEALGVHPFDAERLARQFADDDRYMLKQLAGVHKDGVPLQDNPEYVELSTKLRAEREAQLKGGGRGFNSRDERGWRPPTPKDVQAEIDDNKVDGG